MFYPFQTLNWFTCTNVLFDIIKKCHLFFFFFKFSLIFGSHFDFHFHLSWPWHHSTFFRLKMAFCQAKCLLFNGIFLFCATLYYETAFTKRVIQSAARNNEQIPFEWWGDRIFFYDHSSLSGNFAGQQRSKIWNTSSTFFLSFLSFFVFFFIQL